MKESIIVDLYLANGTRKADFFMLAPKHVLLTAGRDKGVWLPKSQVKILERGPTLPNHWPLCKVQVPLWLAREKKLEVRIAELTTPEPKTP